MLVNIAGRKYIDSNHIACSDARCQLAACSESLKKHTWHAKRRHWLQMTRVETRTRRPLDAVMIMKKQSDMTNTRHTCRREIPHEVLIIFIHDCTITAKCILNWRQSLDKVHTCQMCLLSIWLWIVHSVFFRQILWD